MKRFLLFAATVLLTTSSLLGQTFSNGTGGGNWNSTSTWALGTIPTSGDVVIVAGDAITVNGNFSVANITFNYDASANNDFVVNTTRTLTCSTLTMTPTATNAVGNLTVNGTINIATGASGNNLSVPGSNLFDNIEFNISVPSGGQLLMDNSFIHNSLSASTELNITTVGKFKSGPFDVDLVKNDCIFTLDVDGDFDVTTFDVYINDDNATVDLHLRSSADFDGTGLFQLKSNDQTNDITLLQDAGGNFDITNNLRFEATALGDNNDFDIDFNGDVTYNSLTIPLSGDDIIMDYNIGAAGSVVTSSFVRFLSSGGTNHNITLGVANGGDFDIGNYLELRTSNNGSYDVDIGGSLTISSDLRSLFRNNTSGTFDIASTGTFSADGVVFDHRTNGDLTFTNIGTFTSTNGFAVYASTNDAHVINWNNLGTITGIYEQRMSGTGGNSITTNVQDELTIDILRFNKTSAPPLASNNKMNLDFIGSILRVDEIRTAVNGTLIGGTTNNSTVIFTSTTGDSIASTSTVDYDNIQVTGSSVQLIGPLNASNFAGDLTINAGGLLTLPSSSAGKLTIQGNYTGIAGGSLQNSAGNDFTVLGDYSNTGTHGNAGGDYIFHGDFANTGTFQHNPGDTVYFIGSSGTQLVTGTTTMEDIYASNDVTISSGTVSLERSLTVTGSSTFNSNGGLLMLSTATETAFVTELTAGNSVTGNVRVQRRMAEGVGYHMLGSPTTNGTIAQWADDIWTGGFPGAQSVGAGVSIFTYDESITARINGDYGDGYVGATNATNPLTPTLGFMVYLLTSPGTVEVVGPINQGNNIGTGGLSNNVGSVGTAEDGWHLRSNPYPSPVLWTDVFRQNIQGSGEGFVRRASGGNYWAINADNIDTLYSGEAVWVQATNGSLSRLIFDEADKVIAKDDYNAKSAAKPEFQLPLKMELSYNGNSNYMDYSVLRFGSDTNTTSFDNIWGEARKIGSAIGTVPNISSWSTSDNSDVYYNGLNPEDSSFSIPLRVWTQYPSNQSRMYTIEFNGIDKWVENNHCLILNDNVANTSIKLEANNSSYVWNMIDTLTTPRIFLDHSIPLDLAGITNVSCFGENDGTAEITGLGSGMHTYTWTKNGSTVKTETITGSSSANDLEAGKYIVWVSNNGACGDMAVTFEIESPEPLIASFTAPSDTIFMNQSTSVQFSNTSVNAQTYNWDFGDGNTSTLESPVHSFTSAGLYTVSLSITDGGVCSDVSTRDLLVVDNVGIDNPIAGSDESILIYRQNEETIIEFNLDQEENASIELIDVLGKQVIPFVQLNRVKVRKYILNVPEELNGIYFVRVLTENRKKSEKFYFQSSY
ncbi:MAG: PKD domain-containing protein [Vicingaceae bacterium]